MLKSRGMIISDDAKAEKKLSEIGYYRLSGFWYSFRQIEYDTNGDVVYHLYNGKIPKRSDHFSPNTNFSDVIDLYLFDKSLRLCMLDALERIEIYIRSIIAYEMGKSDPLSYKDSAYIDSKFLSPDVLHNKEKSHWQEWSESCNRHINRSHEDCILWYKESKKPIPIWVAIEVWDFGLMSKYFSMLKGKYKNKICRRVDPELSPNVLNNWLRELNILRNRCAHHTRIWNQVSQNPLLIPNISYFNSISLSSISRSRICGMIAVIWFLVHKVGTNSKWIDRVAEVIEKHSKKNYFKVQNMGFETNFRMELSLFKQSV